MSTNPTSSIKLHYKEFVNYRESRINQHINDGVPDYAFSMDYAIRKQLNQIPLLRKMAEGLLSYRVPFLKIKYEEEGIVVGPQQFPHIYEMSVDCANILGIPVPNIFINYNVHPNAFTFDTGHSDQIVVLTSGLLEALNEKELKSVIGHECGHIHNRHIVYNTLWEILTNHIAHGLFLQLMRKFGPTQWIFQLAQMTFTSTAQYLFGRWHRCAEITCDRAGLICSGDLEATMSVNAKLKLGGAANIKGFNADAYKTQMKNWNKSFFRLEELSMTHPPGPQRAFSVERFSTTDVYQSWRPEVAFSKPPVPLSKVDEEISTFFT